MATTFSEPDRAPDRSDAASDRWRRRPNLLTDSAYPEQIAEELARLHRPYLGEAARLVRERLVPDERALARSIRAETERYRRRHPWLDAPDLRPAFAAADERALAQLRRIAAAAPRAPEPRPPAPRRRPRFGGAPPIVAGTLSLRKETLDGTYRLAWSPSPRVAHWSVRISARDDPREAYAELETVEVAAADPRVTLALDDRTYRLTILGHSGSGRVIERAIVSGLTAENWRTKWTRRPTGG